VKKDRSITYSFNAEGEGAGGGAGAQGRGWLLRNEERKPWAFSINYERHGEQKAMYPDFLIFRKQSGAIVCDVLEPHSQRESDSVAKAKGLGDFASKHGDRFGRIRPAPARTSAPPPSARGRGGRGLR
jgi:hypothetical protein